MYHFSQMSTNVLGNHVTIMVVVPTFKVVTNVTVLRLDIKVPIVHKVCTKPIFNNYRVRLNPISKLSHEMTSYWTR